MHRRHGPWNWFGLKIFQRLRSTAALFVPRMHAMSLSRPSAAEFGH
ncbi:Unknown protein sequence [Pseudomonas syringae pv. maculicola]|nr:Unknown protein sequence [Pseudomonas syringae pv. maculicola]